MGIHGGVVGEFNPPSMDEFINNPPDDQYVGDNHHMDDNNYMDNVGDADWAEDSNYPDDNHYNDDNHYIDSDADRAGGARSHTNTEEHGDQVPGPSYNVHHHYHHHAPFSNSVIRNYRFLQRSKLLIIVMILQVYQSPL